MKSTSIISLALVLILAACSGGKDEEPSDPGKPVAREAGNWKTDIRLVKLDVPGIAVDIPAFSSALDEESGIDCWK